MLKAIRSRRSRFVAASVVSTFVFTAVVQAVPTERVWVGAGANGNWGTTTNWTPAGGFLTSQLDYAIFNGAGVATVNSYLGGGSRAATDLRFTDNADGAVRIDFSDALNGTVARSLRIVNKLDVAPDAAGTMLLNGVGVMYWGIFTDASGDFAHSISNRSTVGGVLNIDVAQSFGETINTTSTTLTYDGTGAINLNGPILTVFPDLRTVNIVKDGPNTVRSTGANTYNGKTTVKAGTLVLANNGVKNAWNSALTNAAGTDIQGGKIVFDYTSSTSPIATIVPLLDAAYDSGFASGQIRSSTAVAGSFGLGYNDDPTASTFTVAFTRYGDFNLDSAVNFDDLVLLAQNYASGTDKAWSQGDTNYDGAVDFSDLVALAQNYGLGALTDRQIGQLGSDFAADFALAQSMVPEPASFSLIALGAIVLRGRRQR
jgi:autotransporter-associated beta strand protein